MAADRQDDDAAADIDESETIDKAHVQDIQCDWKARIRLLIISFVVSAFYVSVAAAFATVVAN